MGIIVFFIFEINCKDIDVTGDPLNMKLGISIKINDLGIIILKRYENYRNKGVVIFTWMQCMVYFLLFNFSLQLLLDFISGIC